MRIGIAGGGTRLGLGRTRHAGQRDETLRRPRTHARHTDRGAGGGTRLGMGRTREDRPEGRDSTDQGPDSHQLIGRGVTRTGQLLPIQVWSTRASVRSGRVATPGPADDTYPTPSRQFWGRLGVNLHRGWSPGSRERLPAAASRVAEYQTGPAGATVAPTRIHPGTPGGSRLAGGNQAQVPGGGGPAVRYLELRVRAERQAQVGLG
jgi:hypothetical protein